MTSAIRWELALVFMVPITDLCRIKLTTRGNKTEQVGPLIWSSCLAAPTVLGYAFFLEMQTYVWVYNLRANFCLLGAWWQLIPTVLWLSIASKKIARWQMAERNFLGIHFVGGGSESVFVDDISKRIWHQTSVSFFRELNGLKMWEWIGRICTLDSPSVVVAIVDFALFDANQRADRSIRLDSRNFREISRLLFAPSV